MENKNRKFEPRKTTEVTGPKTSQRDQANEALQNEDNEQRKKMAELEQQLAKRPAPRPQDEMTNNQRINCWRCGGVGHTIKDCPTKPRNEERTRTYEARREQPRDVRPIHEKQVKTCIVVKFQHHRLSALLDTGSDVSIAGNEVARKYNWKVYPHPIKTVKIANNDEMIIYGAEQISLRVGKRSVNSEILISPDLNGLILGIDWLEKQGLVWDFREQRIKFEDGEWLELQQEEESRKVRRIYVSEDTLLPASQQTEVNVRISHRAPNDRAFVGLIENDEVRSLKHVYSARSLLQARFSDIKVPILNAEKRSQVITKGTELGILHKAEVMDEFQKDEVEDELLKRSEDEELSPLEDEAIEKIISNLPSELNDEQRRKVKAITTSASDYHFHRRV